MHGRVDEEGITLIEVMIALSILLIVFSAFVATLIGGFRSLTDSRARQFSSQFATESIEHLRTLPQSAIALDSDTVTIADISNCTAGTLPGFDPDGPGPIVCEEIISRAGGSINFDDPVDPEERNSYGDTWEGVTYVTVPTHAQDGAVPSGAVRVTVELTYTVGGDAKTVRRQALFSEVSRG